VNADLQPLVKALLERGLGSIAAGDVGAFSAVCAEAVRVETLVESHQDTLTARAQRVFEAGRQLGRWDSALTDHGDCPPEVPQGVRVALPDAFAPEVVNEIDPLLEETSDAASM
tara:strand:- start:798 stop:1139 length:342 start_codon:yes stop_codon:yes gene_type:complete